MGTRWYRELKKLTSFDQHLSEEVIVEDIKHLSDIEQAEKIADKFSAVSQEYYKLEDGDVEIPQFEESEIPIIEEDEIREILEEINANKSNVTDDIPAKILKMFAKDLAKPVWACDKLFHKAR